MTSGVLLQIFFDLVMFATMVVLWVKLNRPQKDDPRLSRGLQLLQSKIAVLEDLSDQVETQVTQISALLEVKVKEVQNQILASDKQLQKIEAATTKSLEVARIFQDRIPHQEIIERQNTVKYVKAARLAHQGLSVEAIQEQVGLDRGEIELIAKVNREQLQFSEDDLPEWVREEVGAAPPPPLTGDEEDVFEQKPLARAEVRGELSLSSLGEKFRQALPAAEVGRAATTAAVAPVIEMPKKTVGLTPSAPAAPVRETATTTTGRTVEIQKVVFPKIDLTQHLS